MMRGSPALRRIFSAPASRDSRIEAAPRQFPCHRVDGGSGLLTPQGTPVCPHGLVMRAQPTQEATMSDYRDPRLDPLDPAAPGGMGTEIRRSNSGVGWIAGAIFLVVILALIFGLGRSGDRSASTGTTPPAAT